MAWTRFPAWAALFGTLLVAAAPVPAEIRTMVFEDPQGDAIIDPDASGDLARLTVRYSTDTEDYQIIADAHAGAGFTNGVELRTSLAIAGASGAWGIFLRDRQSSSLPSPQQQLWFAGTDDALLDLDVGQVVRAGSCDRLGLDCEESGLWVGTADRIIDAVDLANQALVTVEPTAPFEPMRIRFQGKFVTCPAEACQGDTLLALSDETFSGEIVLPSAGVYDTQGNPEWGAYEFGDDAYMTFDSAVEAHRFERLPVRILVHNCFESPCPFKSDWLRISASHAGRSYGLYLGAPKPPFLEPTLPSRAMLETLYPYFAVEAVDYSEYISTETAQFPSPMNVTFEPLAAAPVPKPIPALPGVLTAMLASLVGGLGWRALRHRARSDRHA